MRSFAIALAAATAAFALPVAAHANPLLQADANGALLAHAQPSMQAHAGIDPNTFIVGHPASPRWAAARAGAAHPAVAQARASQAGIDANTFTVQPPASVTWLSSGAALRPLLTAAAPQSPTAQY